MFKSFFASKEYFWRAWGGFFFLIGLIVLNAAMGWLLADWSKDFGNLTQDVIRWKSHYENVPKTIIEKAKYMIASQEYIDRYWGIVWSWVKVVGPNILIGALIVLFGGLYVAAWRESINHAYLPRWIALSKRTTIVGGAQRLQEDTDIVVKMVEDLGLAVVQAIIVLAVFAPRLRALSVGPTEGMFIIAVGASIFSTIIAIFLGRKLPRIEKERKGREKIYRSSLESIEHHQKEQLPEALLLDELHGALEKYRFLLKKGFVLSLWTSTYGWVMGVFPGLLMTSVLITGTATVGDMNEVSSVFACVSGNLSVLAYRWRGIIDIWSVMLRFSEFQKDLENAEMKGVSSKVVKFDLAAKKNKK
jgi:peptide/bleomycin uptake transporter